MARADFFRNYQGCEHHSGGDRAPPDPPGFGGTPNCSRLGWPRIAPGTFRPYSSAQGGGGGKVVFGEGGLFFLGGHP